MATEQASGFWARNWFVLALVVGVPLLMLLVWGIGTRPVAAVAPDSEKDFGDLFIDTLLTLIAVALFMERALEVVIKSSRALGRTEKDNAVLACDREIEDCKEKIDTLRRKRADAQFAGQDGEMKKQIDDANVALEAARERRRTALQEVETYRTQTKKLVHIFALIAGLFIATAGVRALDPMLAGESEGLMIYVDTLLTAGLIAGGADGLHKLISLATTYFDITREGLKGKPTSGQ